MHQVRARIWKTVRTRRNLVGQTANDPQNGHSLLSPASFRKLYNGKRRVREQIGLAETAE
jgi:hypothetical protein